MDGRSQGWADARMGSVTELEKTPGIASRAFFRVAAALTPKENAAEFALGGVVLSYEAFDQKRFVMPTLNVLPNGLP